MMSFWGVPESEYRQYSPYFVMDYPHVPSTTIVVGEHDGIRSDSEVYFEKLKQAHVKVQKIVVPGQTHNTFLMRKALTGGVDPAVVIGDIVLDNRGLC